MVRHAIAEIEHLRAAKSTGSIDPCFVEGLCSRFLLLWRSNEIAIKRHIVSRRKFLRELGWEMRHWGGLGGANIADNVDRAIKRINWRMSSPEAAVSYYTIVDLTLAKYGFAKLPPIIPEPPASPPHKWSVEFERWEPVDPELMEHSKEFMSDDDPSEEDDHSEDDNPPIEQTQRIRQKPEGGYARLAEQHRYFFGEPPSRPARAVHEPNPWAGAVVRVRPETSGRIAEFSEHEAD
jgi:hypothetical protein